MNDKKDEVGNLLSDEKIDKNWNFRSKTSLDEIPQLINVLKGEMSLIGPRPYYQNIYLIQFCKRAATKPGITGWAQVNGRNAMLEAEI
jgi:lipopolysaccharide/colanic/teichoic acid biosynthesis glycosyltransferase